MTHCELIQAGEIQVVVGDASRAGVGGAQYCGVWSLTSKERRFNAFGDSYAGLIPGEIKGRNPSLQPATREAVALVRAADDEYPVDVRASYVLRAPYYIDHEILFRDKRDVRRHGSDFRQVSWASYISSPEDPRIHYLSRGEWVRYVPPEHGVGASVAPAYLAAEELETWPDVGDERPFDWSWAPDPFDRPFYYGRIGEMVVIFVFANLRRLRFCASPSDGGPGILPGKTCPAWNFKWVVPGDRYEVARPYRFRMTLVYKKYVSDEDVLEEVDKVNEARGYRNP